MNVRGWPDAAAGGSVPVSTRAEEDSAEALTHVERRLRDASERPAIPDDALRGFLDGGKRLRARLVLSSGALSGSPPSARGRRLATFVELIHSGALCHDDVADGSISRRGCPTLASRIGARDAVLVGTRLMMEGYSEIACEGRSVIGAAGRALRLAAQGQAEELTAHVSTRVSPVAYLHRCASKTARLYALCSWLGAAAADFPERYRTAARRYGSGFGMAYQLADDVRDIVGAPDLGREAGTDLREGLYTLPVLLTLQHRHDGADELERLLGRILAEPRAADVTRTACLLDANGAFAHTSRLIRAYVGRAKRALDDFPESPARRTLDALAEEVSNGLPRFREIPAQRPVPARPREDEARWPDRLATVLRELAAGSASTGNVWLEAAREVPSSVGGRRPGTDAVWHALREWLPPVMRPLVGGIRRAARESLDTPVARIAATRRYSPHSARSAVAVACASAVLVLTDGMERRPTTALHEPSGRLGTTLAVTAVDVLLGCLFNMIAELPRRVIVTLPAALGEACASLAEGSATSVGAAVETLADTIARALR